MNRRRWPWVVVGIVLVLAVSWALVAQWRLDRAESREAKAISDRQKEVLTEKEWRESSEADRAEMVATVAGLEEQLAAAKAAGARVRVVTRTVTGEATWQPSADDMAVICREFAAGVPPPAPGVASPTGPDRPAPAASVDVGVRARVETALADDAMGRPYAAVAVWATPRIGAVVFPEQRLPDGEVTVLHDPKLQQALEAARLPVHRLDLMLGGYADPDSGGVVGGAGWGGKRTGLWVLGGLKRTWDAPANIDPVVLGGVRVALK